MKRRKTLLWMGALLAALLAAFAAVSQIQPKTSSGEENSARSLGEADLTAFTVTYEQPMTFVKTETGWAYEADDSFPLDQDKAQAMAQVLETLSADKIIVLKGGAIIEEGSHKELLGSGGYYAGLFELQASRYYST